MWRYIVAGITGAVAGAVILLGAAVIFVPDDEATSAPAAQPSQQQTARCDDAFVRRRQADAVIANPPRNTYGASTHVDADALNEARVQRNNAQNDVNRYCGGS